MQGTTAGELAGRARRDELGIMHGITGRMRGLLYRQLNDASFTVVYATPSIGTLTGYPASDFVNNAVRTLTSLTEKEDETYVINVVRKALAKREPRTIDYRIRRASGGAVWVREVGGGVFAERGELKYLEGASWRCRGASRAAGIEEPPRVDDGGYQSDSRPRRRNPEDDPDALDPVIQRKGRGRAREMRDADLLWWRRR